MIRLAYQFRTVGPLHHGSDQNAGTLQSLRRQRCVLAVPVQYQSRLTDDQRTDAVVQLCLAVWQAIDWDKVKGQRLMGIWDEFAGKLTAAARAADKRRFFETLCRSWGIRSCTGKLALDALDALTDYELLDTVRNESLYIVLRLRAIKDAARARRDETGQLTFDIVPVVPGEPRDVVRTEDEIPCLSGNAIRGKMRRLAMYDWCRRAGIGGLDKRVYHTLFTGGFLDAGKDYEDFDRLDRLTAMCPMLALFGAAVGDMMIEGDLKVGWAYPLCRERGTGEKSVWQLLDTVYQTRRDSSKGEDTIALTDQTEPADRAEQQATQMKYEYEVFADGTVFEHRLALASDRLAAQGAFWHALRLFQAEPYLGGKGAVGNGEVAPEFSVDATLADAYCEYVEAHKAEMVEFWKAAKV